MGFFRRSLAVLSNSVCIAVLLFATATSVFAQDTPAPAHIAFVDGSATVEHEGQAQPATSGLPFLPGDRLRTAAGRVELLFPDGSALEVDEYAAVDLQSPTLMRLTAGRIMLIVAGADDPANAVRYQIDTPAASAVSEGPGEYRVALLTGPAGLETELAVFRGAASLSTEQGSTSVRSGERSLARDFGAPSFPLRFNSARFDAFDRWAAARRDARMGTAASAQYLPRDLQMYGGVFDRYGAWQHDPMYGQVWYPTVAPGWRPYYYGHWLPIRRYGWTWIGLDAWGWPTHHYGRWGFGRSRWFWIPHQRWAPAWVSWGAAPGYVSWCPLGFDGRPVFALSVNVVNPWRGWVVVPRTHFGARGYRVDRFAVAGHAIPRTTPFIVQAAAPVAPPHGFADTRVAVPRSAGIAIPRTAAPRTAAQSTFIAPRDAAITRRDRVGGPAIRRGDLATAPPAIDRPGRAYMRSAGPNVQGRAYENGTSDQQGSSARRDAASRALDRAYQPGTAIERRMPSDGFPTAQPAPAPRAERSNPMWYRAPGPRTAPTVPMTEPSRQAVPRWERRGGMPGAPAPEAAPPMMRMRSAPAAPPTAAPHPAPSARMPRMAVPRSTPPPAAAPAQPAPSPSDAPASRTARSRSR
jgi:hypothetical protein